MLPSFWFAAYFSCSLYHIRLSFLLVFLLLAHYQCYASTDSTFRYPRTHHSFIPTAFHAMVSCRWIPWSILSTMVMLSSRVLIYLFISVFDFCILLCAISFFFSFEHPKVMPKGSFSLSYGVLKAIFQRILFPKAPKFSLGSRQWTVGSHTDTCKKYRIWIDLYNIHRKTCEYFCSLF